MGLEYEALTEKIIACAIAVHRELGPGFLESIYENALCVELKTQQIPFQRQLRVPVAYRSVEVGLHRLDLLVAGKIVVELKNIKKIENVHFVIVRSYLHAVERNHGLILNFSKPELEIKRVARRFFPGFLGS
jgi:GxxExxY protein